MPQVDGWEMLRRVQERHGVGSIPVIMFSGKVDEEALRRGRVARRAGLHRQALEPAAADRVDEAAAAGLIAASTSDLQRWVGRAPRPSRWTWSSPGVSSAIGSLGARLARHRRRLRAGASAPVGLRRRCARRAARGAISLEPREGARSAATVRPWSHAGARAARDGRRSSYSFPSGHATIALRLRGRARRGDAPRLRRAASSCSRRAIAWSRVVRRRPLSARRARRRRSWALGVGSSALTALRLASQQARPTITRHAPPPD